MLPWDSWVHQLTGHSVKDGSLLVAGLQVWATNVIAFALLFWNLDRGGPVSRAQLPREQLSLADFRFSHDEDHDAVVEVAAGSSRQADWAPTFTDYLYVSTATAALLTSLLVIARAVGSFT